MRNPARSLPVALVVATLAGAGCEPPPALDDYCPDDPMAESCPGGGCSGPYECVSYCIRHYPEREQVPATGMGSWCDDPRLPDDFGAFCAGEPAVRGCTEYCAAHPGACEGGGDGDADSDSDSDQDEDSASCDGPADCTDPAAARCEGGLCVPCTESQHCGHLAAPICLAGTCVECTAEDTTHCTAERPHCGGGGSCVECLSADDCTSLEAPRCEDGACAACEADADCHFAENPACDGARCWPCSADSESLCETTGERCLAAEHRCVECLGAADCGSAEASRCEDNECAPCAVSGDCVHLPATPSCDTAATPARCVECTSYADCPPDEVCNYTTRTCVEACLDCLGDPSVCASLGAGFTCERDWSDPYRMHCFQRAATCERPWLRSSPGGYCVPPITTSCQGIVDLLSSEPCVPLGAATCGEAAGDAECDITTSTCTYACLDEFVFHDEWCPVGMSCAGTGLCQ